ncbi:urea amidolyase family protein [Rhizobium phaseoli]|uniref:5-oxoprolinase subunit B/C family protein n=1 Tax=Rhizobium phaseoli TaxID=396 RepID=UPI0014385C1A|nr:urea amidolyase family protein [Rhizobium phaseoli]MDK4730619.1 urea amidolyase family protein [Rhizobium phaseoli]NKE91887.1 5-oxoprolinase/urea amidolyase family protein [Rhizobium phaseoli]
MSENIRFLPSGSSSLLVELDGLQETLSLLDALRAQLPEGVRDIIPAARTIMVDYDPAIVSRHALIHLISSLDLSSQAVRHGETFEIPVNYDGEDLPDVAALLGCTQAEIIRRHTEATFIVAFVGFAPGFAYMTCDDPIFNVPRRTTPRVRIPAGSVALAGRFGGVYPSDSPGGWQLIGRTPLEMWDLSRERAALLTPGDRVRFVDLAQIDTSEAPKFAKSLPKKRPPAKGGIRVIRADRPALYQDLGRSGRSGQGVSTSGAMDRESLRRANLAVGNAQTEGAIEIAFGCFELRADRPITVAVTGATCPLTIRTPSGRQLGAAHGEAIALDEGDELVLGFPDRGSRSYLALRGGFAVDAVLGSVSVDTLAKIGPDPIAEGDFLVPAGRPANAVCFGGPPPRLPDDKLPVTLDVILGPRADWFTPNGVDTFLGQEWVVTPESSRVGIRLAGARTIERKDDAELPSEATVLGAIQVPHSGQPVLFAADHPLTGGYPVIAVVAAHHLDLAGQLPIGARVRFKAAGDQNHIVGETGR